MAKYYPFLKGMDENQIRTFIDMIEQDTSFCNDYNINLGVLSSHELNEAELLNLPKMDFGEICNLVPSANDKYVWTGTVCFAALKWAFEAFYREKGSRPTHVFFQFCPDVYTKSAEFNIYVGFDTNLDVDYYVPKLSRDMLDGDKSTKKGPMKKQEIEEYIRYLLKHGLIPELDVETFINTSTVCWPLEKFHSPNHMYFCLTLVRYTSEGQNIARRVIKYKNTFRSIDPFVAISMAHKFSPGYNNGHCIIAPDAYRQNKTAYLGANSIAKQAKRVYNWFEKEKKKSWTSKSLGIFNICDSIVACRTTHKPVRFRKLLSTNIKEL